MVDVAQQVRASDCGSEGRRFEPGLPPKYNSGENQSFFVKKSFIIDIFLPPRILLLY